MPIDAAAVFPARAFIVFAGVRVLNSSRPCYPLGSEMGFSRFLHEIPEMRLCRLPLLL
jgi:hypothetical protein